MIKIYAFVGRQLDMSIAEFREHYEHHHVPLVKRLAPPPGAYQRNYILRKGVGSSNADDLGFDVVTEMTFADADEYQRWHAALTQAKHAAILAADFDLFADAQRLRVCAVDVSS